MQIDELKDYMPSRIAGYRSIWRISAEDPDHKSQSGEPQKIMSFYDFFTKVLGTGKNTSFRDGAESHEFEDYKNHALSTIKIFEIESEKTIKFCQDNGKPFYDYYVLFKTLVHDMRKIRKDFEQFYLESDYRDIVKQYAGRNVHIPHFEDRPVKVIDVTVENYFRDWKDFETESLENIGILVAGINRSIGCDFFGNKAVDFPMYG